MVIGFARFLIFLLIALTAAAVNLEAKQAPNGLLLVTEKNQTLSILLENRNAMQETISYLHEHISDNAVFTMNMNNSTLPKEVPQQQIQMDKVAYINSFIQGAHYVDDYKISIKTVDVQETGNDTVISKEVIVEEGVSLNPYNLQEEGKPFISQTSCTTTHRINGEKAISMKAECHTDTGFLTGV